MKRYSKIIISLIVAAAIALPVSAQAQVTGQMAPFDYRSISANSVFAVDLANGKILAMNNSGALWTPASLTKLVTAMVVLETKPNLNKIVTMKAADEVGGARLATRTGTNYRLKDLLNDGLINSHNNAIAAVARSTGLSNAAFVARMDAKAKSLGTLHSHFNDTTGMSVTNQITAEDMMLLAKAAFANPQIRAILQTPSYKFTATNNARLTHIANNTDKLLREKSFTTIAGKTGYLDESLYNFVGQFHLGGHDDLLVVVLGSKTDDARFAEAKQLALWAWDHQ